MEKTIVNKLNVSQVSDNNITEYFIDAQCETAESSLNALKRLFEFLHDNSADAVNIRIYAAGSLHSDIVKLHGDKLNSLTSPVTWISQPDKENVYPLSFQAHAVSGIKVQPVISENKKIGCCIAGIHADYTHLHVLPRNKEESNFDQTIDVFNKMQETLCSIGMEFSNTLRTWLFADKILSWYNQLNNARDNFYSHHDIFNKLVPASTGIGLANPSGCALSAELFSVRPKNRNVRIEKITSPLQCEALDYKSAFSRAVKITLPGHSRLYVSGTASISQNGDTVFLDDTALQIQMTLKVVDALIKNGGMEWDNSVSAMAYFKDSRDFRLFEEGCDSLGIDIPHVKIEADICRKDLLFEMEMTLIKTD